MRIAWAFVSPGCRRETRPTQAVPPAPRMHVPNGAPLAPRMHVPNEAPR